MALRLCSDKAEAQEAGLSATAAAKLFPPKRKLCEIEWTWRWPKRFEGILDRELTVHCIDRGCDHSDPKAYSCECMVLSTDDPSNKKGTREEGRGPVVDRSGSLVHVLLLVQLRGLKPAEARRLRS